MTIRHCTKTQKYKNKRGKILSKTMLVVVTTQIPTPYKYTLKMNYKFYKTKQINIKINAHNKTYRTHKTKKVYIPIGHNSTHNV
jgi:hypothetical protein